MMLKVTIAPLHLTCSLPLLPLATDIINKSQFCLQCFDTVGWASGRERERENFICQV